MPPMSNGSPTLIISYDCEGKWGMADLLCPYYDEVLTRENLISAYEQLLQLHDAYDVKATWAFVGMMTQNRDEFPAGRDWLEDGLKVLDGLNLPDYDERRVGLKANLEEKEGWFHPETLKLVESDGRHEIGSHSYCHRFFDVSEVSREEFVQDLELVRQLPAFGDRQLSYIYPRNQVGYPEELGRNGFVNYRELYESKLYRLGRAGRVLSEFNLWNPPQPHAKPGSVVAIAPGHFLNWRKGARRRVPAAVTKARWRRMLRETVKNGGVLHLWSHPHNFIDGEGMYDLLAAIMKEAAPYIRSGELKNPTMLEYSMERLSAE